MKGKLHEVIEVQIHIAREMIENNSNVPSAVMCLTTLFRSLQDGKFPAEAAWRIASNHAELPGMIYHRGFSSEVEVIQEALTDLAKRESDEEFVETTLRELKFKDECEFLESFLNLGGGRFQKVHAPGVFHRWNVLELKSGDIIGLPNEAGDWKVRKVIKR